MNGWIDRGDGTHVRAGQLGYVVAFVGPSTGGDWPWWVYRRGEHGWALASIARSLRAAKQYVQGQGDSAEAKA